MKRILIPVDGSENALRAVEYGITAASGCASAEVHLLNIQEPIYDQVRDVMTQPEVERMEIETGKYILEKAKKILDDAGIPNVMEVRIGPVAPKIADYAREMKCDNIIMGTRGMGSIKTLIMGSVTTKVIHLADVPVTLVK